MRIGVLMNERTANAGYRAAIPFNALQERGHDVRWDGRRADSFDRDLLSRCDVVYIHRYHDEHVRELARFLRQRGVALWWDNDDDIRSVPRGATGYRAVAGLRGERIFAGMVKMMQIADLVSTPSRVLAEDYRKASTTPVVLLENSLSDRFLGVRRSRTARDAQVTVGWVAGLEHRVDADALRLREALELLCGRHPHVRVVSVGVDLRLSAAYRHVPYVEFDELPDTVATFDVGLAPIVDNAFNRARSDVKIKEYAAAGTPWLASAVGPYAGHGEAEGGNLVADDEWFDALEQMVSERRRRTRLGKRAAKWGRTQVISCHVGRWEAAADEAVGRRRSR